jgi:hypothetical protein
VEDFLPEQGVGPEADAERDGSTWAPIRAGMSHGSLERFREIATSLGKTVANLSWY